MKDNLRESLSALMDGESDELELRRTLKAVEGDSDDTQVWRRYHLARSLMHRDRAIDVSSDISARVMACIEKEPAPRANENAVAPRRNTLSFTSGAAVAAAVSLMVITGVQFYNGAGSSPAPGLDGTASRGDSDIDETGAAGARRVAAEPYAPPLRSGAGQSLPALTSGGGVMAVSAGSELPMFLTPEHRQESRSDQGQARLLMEYLERHAEGTAHRPGEGWMPLLRASAQQQSTLSNR